MENQGKVILLRTLTFKSKLGGGKFENKTIDELIKMGKSKYLVWEYFCIQHINFTNEILDAIGITKENRINKPGVDYAKYFELFPGKKHLPIENEMAPSLRAKDHSINKRRFVSRLKDTAFNHGHYKPARREFTHNKAV